MPYKQDYIIKIFYLYYVNIIKQQSINRFILRSDNVVKYRFILRSGVSFMELLADYESALTLSFGCHLFNRFYHLLQIALPQMELVSASCFWFQFYYACLFSNFLSFCVSACTLIIDSLIQLYKRVLVCNHFNFNEIVFL